MALDADRGVVAVAAQPMWLDWTEIGSGRALRHAPGLFRPRGGQYSAAADTGQWIGERGAAVFAATARF
jgi:hypothetical protein